MEAVAAAAREMRLMQGNQAIAEGAIYAGARFYAGYPITPSSEIADECAARMPALGGMYIQMEDEMASIAAVIGASLAGAKAFTATSGPGFSLMQENLGLAVMGEVPCPSRCRSRRACTTLRCSRCSAACNWACPAC